MKKKNMSNNLLLITICFVFSNFGNISSVNAQTGNISGWLYQSDGSTPITNSGVGIHVLSGSHSCNLQYVTGIVANPDGSYTTPALEPGNYYLRTWSDSSTNYISEFWALRGSVRNCAEAEAVSVTVGTTNSGKNFQLDEGGKISGWLYQSDGSTPITNTYININVLTGSNPCNYQYVTGIVTNPDGSYTTPALESGNYYLQAQQTMSDSTNYISEYWASGGSVRNCDEAEAITVTVGTTNSGKNFQLDEGGAVSGTIMDTDGTPITGVERIGVIALQGDCNNYLWVGHGQVDSVTGMYTVPGLAPGDYILQTSMQGTHYIDEYWASGSSVRNCTEAETITVTVGTTNSGKNFQLEEGGNISGWLYHSDGRTPIRNSDIYIRILTGSNPCNSQQVSGIVANPDGSYSIPALEPGNYYVQTWNNSTNYIPEYWASGESVRNCAGAEGITVTVGTTNSGKNFQLDEGGAVSGTVMDTGGTPITGVDRIGVYALQGDDSNMLQWVRYGFVDSVTGMYTIPCLPSGDYILLTDMQGTQYINEYWASGSSVRNFIDAETVTVTAGTTNTGKDFYLEQGGNISGWLYQSDGSTAIINSDINIIVFTGDPCNPDWYPSWTVANADGSYILPGLASGNYYLQTWSGNTDYIQEYWASGGSVRNCAEAEAVTVTVGTTNSGKNFQLDEEKTFPWIMFLPAIISNAEK